MFDFFDVSILKTKFNRFSSADFDQRDALWVPSDQSPTTIGNIELFSQLFSQQLLENTRVHVHQQPGQTDKILKN